MDRPSLLFSVSLGACSISITMIDGGAPSSPDKFYCQHTSNALHIYMQILSIFHIMNWNTFFSATLVNSIHIELIRLFGGISESLIQSREVGSNWCVQPSNPLGSGLFFFLSRRKVRDELRDSAYQSDFFLREIDLLKSYKSVDHFLPRLLWFVLCG